MGVARRRLEAIRRELDQQAQRVLEIDRVHESPVLDTAVPDTAFVETCHRLGEGGRRDREGKVVDTSHVCGGTPGVWTAILICEHRDQAPVAGIEVQMA